MKGLSSFQQLAAGALFKDFISDHSSIHNKDKKEFNKGHLMKNAKMIKGHSVRLEENTPTSIEDGYFVFTLMPSLYCHLRCPHCYLSIEERQDKTILSPELIETACRKIDKFWNDSGISDRRVICYWYGGEPTSMGVPMFEDMANRINAVFSGQAYAPVRHTVLTSLVSARSEWHNVFRRYGDGEFQTSYDGDMRGGPYVRKWERQVKKAVSEGLKVSTISVVNHEILEQGPVWTLDYLSDLGIKETSWLPFMWNEQNNGDSYDRFAPTMHRWSDFMIDLTGHWLDRKRRGLFTPEIGQMRYILSQALSGGIENVAAQTLFLMPNGDFVLPDYKNGWQEFMQPFGNIIDQEFAEVLRSPERRKYLRRQATRNFNTECLECPHQGKCVMEFWKDNRPEDDCFGGRRYVDWLMQNESAVQNFIPEGSKTVLY